MRFQIPELCQPYVRDIDDVGGVCDWDFGIWSFEGRAQRQDEIEQVVVQGKKRYELCRRVKGLVVREGLFVLLGVFLICLDVLAIEVLYHVDVEGYASSISMACPLRVLTKLVHVAAADQELYHLPGPLIYFDIIILVQFLHPLLLQPMFCIGELANCAIDVELSGSEVPSRKGQHGPVGRKGFPVQ